VAAAVPHSHVSERGLPVIAARDQVDGQLQPGVALVFGLSAVGAERVQLARLAGQPTPVAAGAAQPRVVRPAPLVLDPDDRLGAAGASAGDRLEGDAAA
jgi:hypothetical protein